MNKKISYLLYSISCFLEAFSWVFRVFLLITVLIVIEDNFNPVTMGFIYFSSLVWFFRLDYYFKRKFIWEKIEE